MSIPCREKTRLRSVSEFKIAGIWFCILTLLFFAGCKTPFEKSPEVAQKDKTEEKSIPGKNNKQTRKFLVTAYHACQKSTCWKPYGSKLNSNCTMPGKVKLTGITANGTRAMRGTIAADVDRYPFGTQMHVPGYGWGEVKDTGMAIKGDRIDVFFESNKEAIKWGKKYLKVAIILPDKYKTER